jgi:hypothetical protein
MIKPARCEIEKRAGLVSVCFLMKPVYSVISWVTMSPPIEAATVESFTTL